MSKYERLARLLKITTMLATNKTISRQELARQCDVSIRTIQRDINTLCIAGIPIYRTERGYRMVPGYFMPTMNLSTEEAVNIITAARSVYSRVEKSCKKILDSAISKIIAGLPDETKAEVNNILSEFEGQKFPVLLELETNSSYMEVVSA